MVQDTGYPVAVLGPFHPYRGGIAHHTTLLARTLATRHPVLGISFKRLYPGVFFPGRTQFDDSAAPLQAQGVEVQRCVDSIAPHTWFQTARVLRDFKPKLLIFQWWHPFFAPAYASIARLARRQGVRIVYLCHNVLPHESTRLDSILIRMGLSAADGYLLQSETDRVALEALLPGRPFVVSPHPAYTFFASGSTDREAARKKLAVDGQVVLFFGLIRAYKGLDVLLRAVARARQKLSLRLLVAGEFYQERKPYEDLMDELQIRDAVRLVDRYIPNEEVETYFRAADLVVLPYRSATQSGIVQISLSFERPVIVTRVGGLPEAVRPGETGEVVPSGDPEALADAMVRFFTEDAASRMQPFLQGAAAEFSWEKMLESVHALGARLGLPTC